ncbi:integral membrane protein [Aspergillus steynii IBT 23096]|uniref:Integral membrane protein n=1 Tax=Aspergillus steynii IBT 23096 TaxID=1392250 RepID=A0A2I2GEZ2_9EURO|nr:uncharacterized protein P170DRAFT_79995 [Aspergillus steynii IBT 23096]PLB51450.1 integral membrane protein [Aspergillus steynii IBT 23096]
MMLNLKQVLLRESEISSSTQRHPLSKITATRAQLLCWPVSTLFLLAILPASVNLPPVNPVLGPRAVAQHYRDHYQGFRAGVAFVHLSAVFYPFYAIAVSTVLSHIPNVNPVLVMAQAAAGIAIGVTFMTLGVLFGTITFRLDRDPPLIQLISDLAWLYFTLLSAMLIVQNILVGILIHSDCRQRPILPVWLAWAHWSTPVGCIGIWVTHCFQRGPFAWNGGLSFWSPVVGYIAQALVNTVLFWIAAGEIEEVSN